MIALSEKKVKQGCKKKIKHGNILQSNPEQEVKSWTLNEITEIF